MRVRGRVVLAIGFDVLEVWRLRSSRLLQTPGLIPLVPFARDADPEVVEAGLRLLNRLRSTRRRVDLQAALVGFAGVVFPDRRWLAMIPEELRMKSSVFDELEQLGRLNGQRDLVAKLLRARLGPAAASRFTRRLKRCEDLKTISSIATHLVRIADDEVLLEELERRLPPARRAAPTRTSSTRRQPSR